MTATAREKIVTTPKLRTDAPNTYCAGCHYGIITRLLCEVIEELGIQGRAIGPAALPMART